MMNKKSIPKKPALSSTLRDEPSGSDSNESDPALSSKRAGESNGSIPNFRVFSILLAAFLVGVFVSSFFVLDFYRIYQLAIIIVLFMLAISLIFHDYIIKIVTAAVIIFFGGFLLFAFSNTKLDNINLPFGQEREFRGIIASYPDVSANSQTFFLATADFGKSANIYIKTSRFPNYNYGDEIKVKAKVEKPTNFSDFDWVSYLKRYGTVATTANNPQISLIASGKGNKVLEKLYLVRRGFELAVQRTLPEPESSLGIGILIGSKQGFSQDIISDFSKVGITHIIALSGYNVTIIIASLATILLDYLQRRQIFFISIVLILLFVAMTGAASSVIRAAIITLLIAYGKTIGRRADMTNLILLSAALMVAINPFVLRFDAGFQLSFLAFSGLIYFSPIVEKLLGNRFFKYWPKLIKSVICETLAAQTFVLPLILSLFGLVSIIAPLTNVLILPVVPATMLFIFLSTLIYWAVPLVGHLAFLITYLPLKYIMAIAEYFAKLPLTSLQITGVWQNVIIIVYIFAITAIFIKYQKKNATKVS